MGARIALNLLRLVAPCLSAPFCQKGHEHLFFNERPRQGRPGDQGKGYEWRAPTASIWVGTGPFYMQPRR
jgi:hypothetical protein